MESSLSRLQKFVRKVSYFNEMLAVAGTSLTSTYTASVWKIKESLVGRVSSGPAGGR
jgi:hypothetical protein